MHYPQIRGENGSLFVEFGQVEERSAGRPLKMVMDLDQNGAVLAIEVINLLLLVGCNGLETIRNVVAEEGKEVRYSYDEDCDCFYLRVKPGRSVRQNAVQGSVFLDKEGTIVALSADSPMPI